MHTSFDKACSIAGVTDAAIKQQLLAQAEQNTTRAKVIEISSSNFAEKSIAG